MKNTILVSDELNVGDLFTFRFLNKEDSDYFGSFANDIEKDYYLENYGLICLITKKINFFGVNKIITFKAKTLSHYKGHINQPDIFAIVEGSLMFKAIKKI